MSSLQMILFDSEPTIAGKTHSEILVMKGWTRTRLPVGLSLNRSRCGGYCAQGGEVGVRRMTALGITARSSYMERKGSMTMPHLLDGGGGLRAATVQSVVGGRSVL